LTTLLAFQFALPLILVCWIPLAPPRNLLGFVAVVTASVSGLLALGLAGIALFPPWWTPYAFGLLMVPAFLIGLARSRPLPSMLPASFGAWTVAVLFLSTGAAAVYVSAEAVRGRSPPSGAIVDLRFPLPSGTYLIVNGGSAPAINAHLATLNPNVTRFTAWRGQSHGIDIVKIDTFGLRAKGLLPPEPGAYGIYGVAVLAPCAGEVVVAIDGLPDMRVPDPDRAHLAGNHLILRCGPVDVLLGHLQAGSLKVAAGMQVGAGQPLALVGNSGNTSEPHLHIHAQQPGTRVEPMSGEPLPVRLDGRFLVRNSRVAVP
jgi:hypothetical protein